MELAGDILDALPDDSWPENLEDFDHGFFSDVESAYLVSQRNRSQVQFNDTLNQLRIWNGKPLNEERLNLILGAIENSLFKNRHLNYIFDDSDHSEEECRVLLDPILKHVIRNWQEESIGLPIKDVLSSLFTALSRVQSSFLDEAWVHLESADRLLSVIVSLRFGVVVSLH